MKRNCDNCKRVSSFTLSRFYISGNKIVIKLFTQLPHKLMKRECETTEITVSLVGLHKKTAAVSFALKTL